MVDFKYLLSLILIFSLTILYSFAYIEILFVIYRLFHKEKYEPPIGFIHALLYVPLLLLGASYFFRTIAPYSLKFDFFFASLGLFFASVALFALGLFMREVWYGKIREMNIKLLSLYSLWIIQFIYLIAVIVCFLLALVSLIGYIEVS